MSKNKITYCGYTQKTKWAERIYITPAIPGKAVSTTFAEKLAKVKVVNALAKFLKAHPPMTYPETGYVFDRYNSGSVLMHIPNGMGFSEINQGTAYSNSRLEPFPTVKTVIVEIKNEAVKNDLAKLSAWLLETQERAKRYHKYGVTIADVTAPVMPAPKSIPGYTPVDDIDAKVLLAAILGGQFPVELAKTLGYKLAMALYRGTEATFGSVDVEALPLGDLDMPHDQLIITAGTQVFKIVGRRFYASKRVPQPLLGENGKTALKIAQSVGERLKGCDLIVGQYASYDVNAIRTVEPLIRKYVGKVTPLPPAYLDIKTPFSGMGISASQEHLSVHYWQTKKGKVDWETWNTSVVGDKEGLPKKLVRSALVAIRDDRNKTCMRANLDQLRFISQNTATFNGLKTYQTYRDGKTKDLLSFVK